MEEAAPVVSSVSPVPELQQARLKPQQSVREESKTVFKIVLIFIIFSPFGFYIISSEYVISPTILKSLTYGSDLTESIYSRVVEIAAEPESSTLNLRDIR